MFAAREIHESIGLAFMNNEFFSVSIFLRHFISTILIFIYMRISNLS